VLRKERVDVESRNSFLGFNYPGLIWLPFDNGTNSATFHDVQIQDERVQGWLALDAW